MKIVWDERKRDANIDKHGLDFADLDVAFFRAAQFRPARFERIRAIGAFRGGMAVAVIFRALGTEAISVVSMRPASAKARRTLDV